MNLRAPHFKAARWHGNGSLFARIIGAVLGGYALAALISVAPLAFPVARAQAVLTGMLASFLVYTATVIWFFGARTARRAWTGFALTAMPLLLLFFYIKAGI